MIELNFGAVLEAAVMSLVVGGIWYGPLFGKKFIEAKGMENMSPEEKAKMQKGMMWTYLWQFIASLLMFYVFAWMVSSMGLSSVMGAVKGAFWVWLGFIVPIEFGNQLWGGKKILFWLSIGNMLVTLLVGAVIIGVW